MSTISSELVLHELVFDSPRIIHIKTNEKDFLSTKLSVFENSNYFKLLFEETNITNTNDDLDIFILNYSTIVCEIILKFLEKKAFSLNSLSIAECIELFDLVDFLDFVDFFDFVFML